MKTVSLIVLLSVARLLKCDDATTTFETTQQSQETSTPDLNNTLEQNATTIPPATSNVTTEVAPTVAPRSDLFYPHRETCICDLQANACDINCCCDEDCSAEDKYVFSECLGEENVVRDARFCDYIDHIYSNNTPFEWDINKNGLFCIAKYNMPKEVVHQKDQSITTAEVGKLQKKGKYSWPSLDVTVKQPALNISTEMRLGDNIWLIRNRKSVNHFQLPSKFATNACLVRKNVLFLKSFKSTCGLSYIDEENTALWALNYFDNVTVIAAPKLYNVTLLKQKFKECPRNICIEIDPYLCSSGFENCVNVSRNDTRLRPTCHVSIYDDENACVNLAGKIKYAFFHNGTRGFTLIQLHIVLVNVTHKLSDEFPGFSQEFSVEFLWANHTTNYSSLRSGNPGYIVGKPVLGAHFLLNHTEVNVTGTNETKMVVNTTFSRNPEDFVGNFLTLPNNEKGICVLSNKSNNPIEFGFNTLLKCKLQTQLIINRNNPNYTCRNLQKVIFGYWSVPVENSTIRVVANFGNADLANWSPMLYEVTPQEALNNVTGQISNGNTTLICHNLTTTLRIDFFHARVVYKDLQNQQKILGTVFSFEDVRSLKFADESEIEVAIKEKVTFFDITSRRVKKFADPPTFDIKLPYDFFYPFVKMNNGGSGLLLSRCTIALIFFVCLTR